MLLPGPFKDRLKAYGAPNSAYDSYADNSTAAYARNAPSGVASAVLTDRMFRIPTYRVAEARADGGAVPGSGPGPDTRAGGGGGGIHRVPLERTSPHVMRRICTR